jgi:hypothetical protein
MPTPEELARQEIDALLQQCGWVVQTKNRINLTAAPSRAAAQFAEIASDLEKNTGLLTVTRAVKTT